ncbi:MAG: helix-turn-helix domain containing protein [Acidithiobacillus sp.]|nr:helix-turn-helix domain containing protein [Acidithiobacillus sp.]
MSMMTRTEDRARLRVLEASLSAIVAETMTGFDHNDQSSYTGFDPQAQRDADYAAAESADEHDPALREWCIGAPLKNQRGSADLAVLFLREHDPLFTSDDAVYLTENQEWNSRDRILVDVPSDGRRRGGTHGLPPELRRTRSAKVINTQLLRWDATRQEREEAEGFYHTVNAKIARGAAYVRYMYMGKHGDVLALLLKGKSTLEIAQTLGKTTRRVRQIVNGHAQRGLPGLRQFIDELLSNGVPADFQRTDPVAVVHSSPKAETAGQQLALDLVIETEVAA